LQKQTQKRLPLRRLYVKINRILIRSFFLCAVKFFHGCVRSER
jgi:hypothetical protein